MLKSDIMGFLLFLKVLVLATAAGTKSASGNQWPQSPPQQRWPQTKGPLGGWDDEVSNPRGGYPQNNPQWKLEDSIPGVPGQSYPNFDKLPATSFDCGKQLYPGYYADAEAQCQVFHICQADGRQNSFLCPIGTIFNQKTFVCDWWFNVNCAETQAYASRNGNLFRNPYIGINGMKVNGYFSQTGQRTRGNMQQPAVGIPSIGSQAKRGNWPSQGQGQFQGQFPQGGSSKGGNKNAIQDGNIGGQVWQNRGHGTMKGGQGRQNSGINQKGSRKGQHPNMGSWQQRGNSNNMKGGQGMNEKGSMRGHNQNIGDWQQQGMNRSSMKGNRGGLNPQINQRGIKGRQNTNVGGWQQPGLRRKNNQKGGNFPRRPLMNKNQHWNMRGDMDNGNVNNMRQFRQLVDSKGERGMAMNQRLPNIKNSQKGDNSRNSIHRGTNQNTGVQQSKNFKANSWSMRRQNFQEGFQDRTESGSDAWPNNSNKNMEPHMENYPETRNQLQNTNQPFRDDGNNLNPFDNTDWNSGEGNFPQWNGNIADGNEYGRNDDFERHVSGAGHRWQNNENSNREVSWKVNNQWRKDREEVDYDYS